MLRLFDLQLIGSKEELKNIPEGKVLINTINAHSYNVAQRDPLFAEALDPNPEGDGDSEAVRNGAELLRNADATIRCRYEKEKGNGNVNVNGNQNLEPETWNRPLAAMEPGTGDVQSPMEPAACGPRTLKYLIPDGNSIVKACRWLKAKSQPKERIAGWDLFCFEMGRVEDSGAVRNADATIRCRYENIDGNGNVNGNGNQNLEPGTLNRPLAAMEPEIAASRHKRVMFMGSSERVLEKIKKRAEVDYPNLEIVTYSPPYKPEFSEEDNQAIIKAINEANPDLLWIGMTAPKQEKWVWQHWQELNINCHVGTIGAVFDFYAGTARRAPRWWQEHGLEWLYRLIKEPRRMWRRYVIGNPLFIWNVMKEMSCKGY